MSKKRIVGYVILHRHGHRAPEKNLFKLNNNEIELWESFLPSKLLLEELSKKFPIKILHNKIEIPIDLQTKPFGCLTYKGINHLKDVGINLKNSFPLLKNIFNIKIYATNYQRTQVN